MTAAGRQKGPTPGMGEAGVFSKLGWGNRCGLSPCSYNGELPKPVKYGQFTSIIFIHAPKPALGQERPRVSFSTSLSYPFGLPRLILATNALNSSGDMRSRDSSVMSVLPAAPPA